ncbi:MAG: FtsX-like permease family protein [Pseudomonadota bacterium]
MNGPAAKRDPFIIRRGTGRLTVIVSLIMVFLCVLTVAFSSAALRLAGQWSNDLRQTATIRLPFNGDEVLSAQTAAITTVLGQTSGVQGYEVLPDDDVERVLQEWVGERLDLAYVPLPRLIRIELADEPIDIVAFTSQLKAVAPEAFFDDHSRWQAPLTRSVSTVRLLALSAIVLLLGTLGMLIWLSLQTSLAINARVISVMRLLGSEDRLIEHGFLKRYLVLVATGSAIGFVLGVAILMALPKPADPGALLSNITLRGSDWFIVPPVPIVAIITAYFATRAAVRDRLAKEA